MKTIEYMISVMQAYADGRRIERQSLITPDGGWFTVNTPVWNWDDYIYRVKPEQPKKKIVPYESAEEFLQAQKEHGPYIKRFNMLMLPVIVEFYNNEKEINSITVVLGEKKDRIMISNLVNNTWQDGTPCGKEVEV